MNSYFRWYRMDDDLCVEYAEMRLGGQAKIYWENESHATYRRGEPITSWMGMTSRLRNKYVPRQYETTLFLNWLDLRQGKMPVRDYIQAFEECRMRCRFVEDSRVVLGIFIHGLSPRLRNEVLKSTRQKSMRPTVLWSIWSGPPRIHQSFHPRPSRRLPSRDLRRPHLLHRHAPVLGEDGPHQRHPWAPHHPLARHLPTFRTVLQVRPRLTSLVSSVRARDIG